MEKVLITGGAGFVGSHIVDHFYEETDWDIVVLDRLNYAGSLHRLKEYFGNPRVRFVFHDFRAEYSDTTLRLLDGVTHIVHNGGETHVENSLRDPGPFVTSNVLGTMNTLQAARRLNIDHFVYTSTDEVQGPAPDGVYYKEDDPIRPSNPYAATKAGAEALCYAWWKAYGLPVTVTRCMNMFGQKQHPEKFLPYAIREYVNDRIPTFHGGPAGTKISRKWLHARNEADAILFLIRKGLRDGETYHIAGIEKTNLEVAEMVAGFLGKPFRYDLLDYHSLRPGHDRRYSMDDSKLRGLGWRPPLGFEDSLRETVEWSRAHPEWLEGEHKLAVSLKEIAPTVD